MGMMKSIAEHLYRNKIEMGTMLTRGKLESGDQQGAYEQSQEVERLKLRYKYICGETFILSEDKVYRGDLDN